MEEELEVVASSGIGLGQELEGRVVDRRLGGWRVEDYFVEVRRRGGGWLAESVGGVWADAEGTFCAGGGLVGARCC